MTVLPTALHVLPMHSWYQQEKKKVSDTGTVVAQGYKS